jgi:hypothetical protein
MGLAVESLERRAAVVIVKPEMALSLLALLYLESRRRLSAVIVLGEFADRAARMWFAERCHRLRHSCLIERTKRSA